MRPDFAAYVGIKPGLLTGENINSPGGDAYGSAPFNIAVNGVFMIIVHGFLVNTFQST